MPLKLNSTPEGTNNLLITILQQQMGIGTKQTFLTPASTFLAPSGSYIWAIKAIGGNVTISDAYDINGNYIPALDLITIKESDIFVAQLSQIYIRDTSTGVAVIYCMNTDYIY